MRDLPHESPMCSFTLPDILIKSKHLIKNHFTNSQVAFFWNIFYRDENVMTDVATDVSEHTFILTVIH